MPISPNVPISPNFYETHIITHFIGVIIDVTLKIEFPKSNPLKLYLITFGRVFNSTHFDDKLYHLLIIYSLYSLKLVRITPFRTSTLFFVFFANNETSLIFRLHGGARGLPLRSLSSNRS